MSAEQANGWKHFEELWKKIETYPSELICGTLYYQIPGRFRAWVSYNGSRTICEENKDGSARWYVSKHGGKIDFNYIVLAKFLKKKI